MKDYLFLNNINLATIDIDYQASRFVSIVITSGGIGCIVPSGSRGTFGQISKYI